ncbi:MAG: helix-turn-helix domain-containing protein [Fibrobacteria bacterium]|nr:helix-turn-helix domain-containing protein [Fibrobacteria bacterium]
MAFLIIFLVSFSWCLALGEETVILTDPKPLSVVNGDLVRLRAEVSGVVEWVEFFVSYEDLEGNREEKSLGQVKSAPFEALWDCRMVPDQNSGRLYLYFSYQDSSGLHEKIGYTSRRDVAIDRTPEVSSAHMLIPYVSQVPVIDGNLEEWDSSGFQYFSSSDNTVGFYAGWNEKAVFFGIEVKDEFIFCFKDKQQRLRFPGDTISYPKIWLGDGVELNLDVLNNKHSIRDTTHREIMISADGVLAGIIQDNFNSRVYTWAENVEFKTKIHGTINDDSDSDSGFTVELAVPWDAIYERVQDRPALKNGMKIGFSLYNYDRDGAAGTWTFGSWNPDIVKTNNDNPSEWGTLVLQKRRLSSYLVPVIFLVCILLIWFIVKSKFKKEPVVEAVKEVPVEDPIDALFIVHEGRNFAEMKLVIQELWDNPQKKVVLKDLTDSFNLGADRLRQLFVQFTGKSFKELFVHIKIEKAKRLLKESQDLTISQIAYQLGYEQTPQFNKIFKKRTGLTPQGYRENK